MQSKKINITLKQIDPKSSNYELTGQLQTKYNIVVTKQQENEELSQKNYFVINDVKDKTSERIKNCKAFCIHNNKQNMIELYQKVGEKIDQISDKERQAPFFAIILKRDIQDWFDLRQGFQKLQTEQQINQFVFSLLFYVQKDMEYFNIKNIKQCKYSFLDNIYCRFDNNKLEFKIFLAELYLMSQLHKNQQNQQTKNLSQNDIYGNIIIQLFNNDNNHNINQLQELELTIQITNQKIQSYDKIYSFFEACKNSTKSKIESKQKIDSSLRSYLCENLFKDPSYLNKIQELI